NLMDWMQQLPAFRPYVPRQQKTSRTESAEDALNRFEAHGDSYYHDAHVDLGVGHPVHLLISMADADPAEFSDALGRARNGVARISRIEREIRFKAAFDLQSETSQFPRLVSVDADRDVHLSSITFYPDGSACLNYGVADFIGGRMVEIWTSPDGDIGTASIGD